MNILITCCWKDIASYQTIIIVDGKESKDAAWYYPTTKQIPQKNSQVYFAFQKDIQVQATSYSIILIVTSVIPEIYEIK